MSIVIDGRGLNKKIEAEKNRQRIKVWVAENPGKTKKECCEALGVTYKTLQKHLATIEENKGE